MIFKIEHDPKNKNIEKKLNDDIVLKMFIKQHLLKQKIKPLKIFKIYKYEFDFEKFLLKQVEDIFKHAK